jgi:hypothetical protein
MKEPFSYTKDQTNALKQALKNAGLKRDADWPRYLNAITQSMRVARHKATPPSRKEDVLIYASKAARLLNRLIKALDATLQEYEGLGSALHSSLDYQLPMAFMRDPLLMASLPASERPVAECLLSSGRFPIALKAVREATAMAAEPLRHAGKPIAVPKDVLDMLPPKFAELVEKNASRRRHDGLFQVTGAPKNHAIRDAVRSLWVIYDDATGKPPTMYSTAHGNDGYAGEFYKFAAAALGPTHLVDNKVLGSNILSAYNEFRRWLKKDRPEKKVKTPR